MSSYNRISWLLIAMTIAVSDLFITSGDPRRHSRRQSDSCEARSVDSPCLNGGQCRLRLTADELAQPALVSCRCPPAWTGATCELERDPCADGSAICGPGWSCARNSSNAAAGYDCGCGDRPGWRRLKDGTPRCVDVDECALLMPACFNGGRCYNGDGTYNCVCKPGFAGRRCGHSDGSDGWTNWGLWSACSSHCGPGQRSRSRSQLGPDGRPRHQQQRRPCRGPCWAGQLRLYTERPPTVRPRRRRPAPRVKRAVPTVTAGRDGPPEQANTESDLDQPAPAASDRATSTQGDADEAAVRELEADSRQVDSEVSAFEHMADKMATFARDLASRAAATAGRLSHRHEALLSSITNSSSAQQARRRAQAAGRAAAAAQQAASDESARLEELRQQSRTVQRALRDAEAAVTRWHRLEAERRQAAEKAEHQLPCEEALSREVALPSRAADGERAEERRRLQATLQRLESLLLRQRAATARLRQRAAASTRRGRRARRRSAQLVARRRQVLLEQAASRRGYTDLNERRLAAARRRAHQALLKADTSVGERQELLGRAAAAATQQPWQRWRPPTPPPPPPAVLRLNVLLPDPETAEGGQADGRDAVVL